ncbi:Membrane protein involved in the export of O-antigen and teichoic acid [Muriicola jejuensis]|uniref:Oligosaccharide flippase family protein n=1 Tax=Muriicola jejuensis TaxID=504488 RepID=A0A6P0UKE1_9FLAO|nr:lipopolysaccharide biosynthesis protein [Muriicola jejuensis]NER11523.1 oligosaccharide flippase family protein [Muriicola jejuensis]SMP20078.1 Membrane protein involved in the export of O-antigen and teichoic acid [Muriicola jejuensis]
MAWSAGQKIILQAVQFIVGIILARILSPKEYGIMSILMVFIVISNVFIDSGFSKALIQKLDRSENDKSTVFLFNLAISVFFYFLLYFLSPQIARFYEIGELSLLLKTIGISIVINALYTVPFTLFSIEMDFKSISKINIIASFCSSFIAIYLAFDGFGVWALVYQILSRSLITLLLTWYFMKWLPNMVFSNQSFKAMFSFGFKLLISNLLAISFGNINSLLIGKYLSARELGFFSRGKQFSDILYNLFSTSIDSVLLPGLSPLQNQKEKMVNHSKTIIKSTSLVALPIFLILAILAKPIILYLLTDKWAFAIPIMQIFCIARLATTIGGINLNLLYVIGRTDLVLKQQYICIAIRVILVLSALPFGIIYIAMAELITSLIHYYINAYYPGKLLGYGGFSQLKDILYILFAGVLMSIPLFISLHLFESHLMQIMIGSVISLALYILFIKWFKVKELDFILNKAKSFRGN